ncbi:MAG TPA: glycosyltransferase, partial [Phycisphaerae bacterium]|nr:glycosyltransferase [Phycisphaerae bacterium]
ARVRLVEITDLPHGWIGKTHALSIASTATQADYLLFMDCDCRFVPGAIAAVMQKVTRDGVQFASLVPSLELRSPAERLLTPPTCWLLGLWAMLGFKRGEQHSEIRLGNGQFMLFSREAYQKIGGHASVQDELAEDMTLANRAAELGLRRWVGMGKGLYVTSRNNDLWGAVNALTRVLIGTIVSPWRILLSPHLLFGGVAAPLWMLPLAAYCAVSLDEPAAWALGAVALLHVLIMHNVVRKLFGIILEESPSIWTFMVGSFATGLVVHWTWLVTTGRGHVRWGKTVYRVRGSRVVDVFPETTPSMTAS